MSELTIIPYQEFRPKYDEQHQASIPVYVEPISDNPRWMTWALLAMFICSALLSGVHTVPTAYDTIDSHKVAEWVRQPVALGVFVFIELGIFFTSYSMFKKWSRIAFSILAFCILIAMGANLYSVSLALKSNDLGAQIVGIMFGLAAPFIAMMTGKQYVNFQRADAEAIAQAKRLFQERKIRYDKNVEMAYINYQKRIQDEIDRIRIEKEQQLQLEAGNSLNLMKFNQNSSRNKPSPKMQKALDYLRQHPEHLETPSRELEVLIDGVSYGTINKAQVMIRSENGGTE